MNRQFQTYIFRPVSGDDNKGQGKSPHVAKKATNGLYFIVKSNLEYLQKKKSRPGIERLYTKSVGGRTMGKGCLLLNCVVAQELSQSDKKDNADGDHSVVFIT